MGIISLEDSVEAGERRLGCCVSDGGKSYFIQCRVEYGRVRIM